MSGNLHLDIHVAFSFFSNPVCLPCASTLLRTHWVLNLIDSYGNCVAKVLFDGKVVQLEFWDPTYVTLPYISMLKMYPQRL
jgi:hypothetical protein